MRARASISLGATMLLVAGAVGCGASDGDAPADTEGVAGQAAQGGTAPGAGSSGNASGGYSDAVQIPPSTGAWQADFRDARVDVTSEGENDCSATPALLEASELARVNVGESTIYAGYDQVTGNNQDPVVARVDGDAVTWCRHHENDGPDGRALGITWDGGSTVYIVYTIVGGGSDLEREGWFRSYGGHAAIAGGGPKVSVLGRVDALSGELVSATHVIAVTGDRKVNTHRPSGAARVTEDGSIEFYGESAHKPIGADAKTSMVCSDYPFNSKYRFSADLNTLLCAQCTNCSDNVLSCP